MRVALLAGVQAGGQPLGIGFALLTAVPWAGYILLGKRVADASVFAAPRTWLFGVGVGVLSSAVPYGLDQVVLKRGGRARFALLLALLPATAAVAGIALVIAALVMSAGDGDTVRPRKN